MLEGSVRKSASRVRITGQLIDASTNAHLWAERFDGTLEDIFDLQDRVATSVAAAIAPSPTIDATSRRVTILGNRFSGWMKVVWLISREKFTHQSASAG